MHFDHVGPIGVESIAGAKWVLNAADDHDGWVESYPSKSKTEAAACLKM